MNRYHPRVLYIDIDIHHGDGVEQAFYTSNRVMTVSFHKYTGDFFPGTGKLEDNGMGLGKYFSLNVPLRDGIDDEMYLTIFKTVIEDTVTAFRPTSIVLQCGADSLGCDRLGAFNLSIAAHGECVNFVRKFNVPLLVLGGGGYTVKNVGRCWAYETAVLVGASVPDELPRTIYDPFFRDSRWKLHPPLTGKVDNQNSAASLQRITISIRNKLRYLQGAPSVAMSELPPDLDQWLEEEKRSADRKSDKDPEMRHERTVARNEFYDGNNDVDQDEAGKDKAASQKPRSARKRGRPRNHPVPPLPDEETEDSTMGPPVRKPKGRPKTKPKVPGARGRGRPRNKVPEPEESEDSHRDPDVEQTRGASPFMDVEIGEV